MQTLLPTRVTASLINHKNGFGNFLRSLGGVEHLIRKRMEKQEWDDDDDFDIEEYEWEKQNEWSGCGWVMDAGKKVIMAGIVISSAPVLLPPLLLVSALGLAMSVPSGVVLASYACTHKLMTKLLPLPNYQQQQQQDEEEEEEEIKNENEMRIELVDDDREICYPPNKHNDVQVGRERELEEEREMSSSSSTSSEDENINHVEVEEIEISGLQVKQGLVLRNDNVNNINDTATAGDKADHSLELKEEKDKDSHGVNGGLGSHEEMISEEKIWEKIDAIRVIVGFKAPKRSSYVEEVKALYLFTGIQPPTQDQSHLAHLNFLMSVIGLQ